MGKELEVFNRLLNKGVSRRDFMKFSTTMARFWGWPRPWPLKSPTR